MTNDSIPDSVYSANNPLYARYRDALLAIRRWLFGNDSAGISDAWIEAYARKIITICEMHGWNLNDQASYEKAVRFDLSTRGLL